MQVVVTNAQRGASVDVRGIERLARGAARRLRISGSGTMAITFVSAQQIRRVNRRALGHDWATDVLTFRYDHEPIIGEMLIAPTVARTYAKAHGIPYEEELSRYVIHGLLHWLGHEDATPAQQKRMRTMEDQLLTACFVKRIGVKREACTKKNICLAQTDASR